MVIGEGLVNVWSMFEKGSSDVLVKIIEFAHSCFRTQIAIRDSLRLLDRPKSNEAIEVLKSAKETCKNSIILGTGILKDLELTVIPKKSLQSTNKVSAD